MPVDYQFTGTTGANKNQFRRAVLDSSDSANWPRAIYNLANWSSPDWQVVADNVQSFGIILYAPTATTTIATTTVMNQLPRAALLQFSLLDKKSADQIKVAAASAAMVQKRSARTFTKYILLNTDP